MLLVALLPPLGYLNGCATGAEGRDGAAVRAGISCYAPTLNRTGCADDAGDVGTVGDHNLWQSIPHIRWQCEDVERSPAPGQDGVVAGC